MLLSNFHFQTISSEDRICLFLPNCTDYHTNKCIIKIQEIIRLPNDNLPCPCLKLTQLLCPCAPFTQTYHYSLTNFGITTIYWYKQGHIIKNKNCKSKNLFC